MPPPLLKGEEAGWFEIEKFGAFFWGGLHCASFSRLFAFFAVESHFASPFRSFYSHNPELLPQNQTAVENVELG